MRPWSRFVIGGIVLGMAACNSRGEVPLSMRLVILDAPQLPDGGKWNDLLGRPLVEVEYSARTGGRALFLYDGRSGECRTVIHAPASPGDPMLVSWAPCR